MMLVAAFQQGRFAQAGASDIGWATSINGGLSWSSGSLPGTTTFSGGLYDSVSDPSIAYDAKHAVWLIASLPIFFSNTPTPAVLISRSADGVTWSNPPVSIAPNQTSNDKDWITCDDTPASPFYGNCYAEWDDPSSAGRIHMSTSSDGGQTWSAPANTANNADGIGGQPLVQPNGTVIVPINDNTQSNMLSFTSSNGGASWSAALPFTAIFDHFVAGNMRTSPLPSAAMDGSGKVYLAWQDCRYRSGCTQNDIVISTSTSGTAWSVPVRVPIDAVNSTVDHFIPGLAVDPMTMGAGAHIGLTYYYFTNTSCSVATCQLFVAFVGSQDGGTTWTTPVKLGGPMNLAWLAQTVQGPMVGDYISGAFTAGQPTGVFAIANAPATFFDEGMYASKPGAISIRFGQLHAAAERPVPGARSDHGPRPGPPIR
jgi:hypothetical protein